MTFLNIAPKFGMVYRFIEKIGATYVMKKICFNLFPNTYSKFFQGYTQNKRNPFSMIGMMRRLNFPYSRESVTGKKQGQC